MRIAFAAALSLLATPSLASGASTLHIRLVVTGDFAPSLVGAWDARTPGRGVIYHFVVGDSSGLFYELVSVPLRDTSPTAAANTLGAAPLGGTCDLRVGGVIYSLEQASSTAGRASGNHSLSGSSYEMLYAIQSADVVTSSTNVDACKVVAASYLQDIPATEITQRLILSRAAHGRFIDGATGVEYTRTP